MQLYYDPYLSARVIVEDMDFIILFALEYSLGNGLEVLIYGIALNFLLRNPNSSLLMPVAYGQRIRKASRLVILAHLYRERFILFQS